ncbi:MAG: bifunctional tRNA (5-methylaminomethyl-2-thiouridine)(34)-methyltransferase MnmD/FAD-dependent 5-carboxymethylaminomethyl-2-thiouridine(34) oxidoreductase MnmC [Motiliproteus sp.]|nr:bifunctional tRNA (5-methylaminomethyl-2-thiouridine)(34)-methyltransferase MnmD/FAD-dependent 5-carboxymethylaminomethyl-2-thiouridine(34) oxidoreductase MnmC [Motiliproteus sp.]MCW9051726.1 bifunctional tRNA (5-methylaminomethyl-2-thiouridine)(34)-methyltransferase MnmD/FAD-dependent 5-carboxymethylaminomethyl-2-thiouridine(34) oxidoreductase MnmC [Motiliproteus sp.]
MSESQPIAQANIRWDETGLPLSEHFQDFYFSKLNGLEETHYVFLENNKIPQRWKSLAPNASFTIAETGFGTGLNFLATWQSWQQQAPADARLHYLSVEKYPLALQDLQKALALWPQLAPLADQLTASYPISCDGFHRLHFDQGRVTLTLMLGDADRLFDQLEGQVDAWYLDGFSPAKNPDMWTESLFSAMAEHSHGESTYSTFTAASIVSRGLTQHGFSVEKRPGFGRKREMLRGQYQADEQPAKMIDKPWFTPPQPILASKREAMVIGAGIAGCSAARSLANRGWKVSLIDRHSQVAEEASGNDQGILYAKLPAKPTLASRIHLAGYLYSQQLLQQLLPGADSWSDCGLLQLALSPKEHQKQLKLLDLQNYPPELVTGVDTEEASRIAGCQLQHPALYFPSSGWINPPSLCRELVSHPNIRLVNNQEVDRLQQSPSGTWSALDQNGEIISQASVAVIATAHHTTQFSQLQWLPLKSIRGQVSSLPQPSGSNLNTVICGNSYISPPWRGRFCFGATFNLRDDEQSVRIEDHHHNLENTQQLVAELTEQLKSSDPAQWRGRVGFRCTTPDYLPIVGAIPDQQQFIDAYAELSFDAKAKIDHPPQHLSGLYCSLGHGSKGMITAPLAGETIASMVDGDPLPLQRPLLHALNPARFIIKDLIRRAI